MGQAGTFVVRCACGEKLTAPAGSEGKKARCPGCGTILTIANTPAPVRQTMAVAPVAVAPVASMARMPVAAPKRVSPAVPEPDDSPDAIYDIADHVEVDETASVKSRCLQCSAEMDEAAVLCVRCGYDTRTGKKLTTDAGKPKKANQVIPYGGKKPVEDRMAAQGSLVMGVLVCCIGGAVAGAAWFGLSMATGYLLPFIGLFTGIACGAGMHIGQKGTSDLGGIIAASITLASIILTKFALVFAVILPIAHAQLASEETTVRVAFMIAMIKPSSFISIVVGCGIAWRTGSGSMTG